MSLVFEQTALSFSSSRTGDVIEFIYLPREKSLHLLGIKKESSFSAHDCFWLVDKGEAALNRNPCQLIYFPDSKLYFESLTTFQLEIPRFGCLDKWGKFTM